MRTEHEKEVDRILPKRSKKERVAHGVLSSVKVASGLSMIYGAYNLGQHDILHSEWEDINGIGSTTPSITITEYPSNISSPEAIHESQKSFYKFGDTIEDVVRVHVNQYYHASEDENRLTPEQLINLVVNDVPPAGADVLADVRAELAEINEDNTSSYNPEAASVPDSIAPRGAVVVQENLEGSEWSEQLLNKKFEYYDRKMGLLPFAKGPLAFFAGIVGYLAAKGLQIAERETEEKNLRASVWNALLPKK